MERLLFFAPMSVSYKAVTETFGESFASLNALIDKECQASTSPLLKELLSHTFKVRGKMLRPLFTFSLAQTLGLDSKSENVLNVAAGLEILHTASLVHDDIIDNGEIRRGQATVNKKWGIGEATLLGDWLLAKSFELMTRTRNFELIHAMTLLTSELTEGQFLENESNQNQEYPEEVYLQMIDLKTSSMFRWAGGFVSYLKAGASDQKLTEQMKHLGTSFGAAFQVVDDLIDLLQKEEEAQKTTQLDLLNGTKTLPVLRALKLERETGKSTLSLCLNSRDFGSLNMGLEAYLREMGVLESCFNLANNYIQDCKNILSEFPDSVGRSTLLSLCELTLSQVRSRIH